MEQPEDPRQEVDALRKDIDDLRSELKNLLRSVKRNGSEHLEQAKSKIWEIAKDFEHLAHKELGSVCGNLQEAGQKAMQTGRAEIHKRPLVIVAGAFFFGLLLSRIRRK